MFVFISFLNEKTHKKEIKTMFSSLKLVILSVWLPSW